MTGLCGKRERERARVQQPKDGEGEKRKEKGKGKRVSEKWKEKIHINIPRIQEDDKMFNWKIGVLLVSSAPTPHKRRKKIARQRTGLDRKGLQVRRPGLLSDVRDGLDIVPRFPVSQFASVGAAAVPVCSCCHWLPVGEEATNVATDPCTLLDWAGSVMGLYFGSLMSFSRYRNRERVLTTTKKLNLMIRFFSSSPATICTRI